jgi:hypothetical protein
MDRLNTLTSHLVTATSNNNNMSSLTTSQTAAEQTKLVGRCACGSVSWEGLGDPAVTFYCRKL